MELFITLLELIPNLIEALCFVYLIFHCLTPRYSPKWLSFIILIHFTCCTFFTYVISSAIIRTLLMYGINLTITFLFTKSNKHNSQFFLGSMPIVLSFFAEKLTIFSSKILIGYPIQRIDETTITRYGLIFLYIFLLIQFNFIFVHIKNNSLAFPKPLLLVFFFGFILAICSSELLLRIILDLETAKIPMETSQFQLISISFILFIFLMFFLVAYIGKIYEKNLSLTMEKQQLILEHNQLTTLHKTNQFLRGWKHDFQNHMNTLA